MTTSAAPEGAKIHGRHVLGAMLAFFGVVFVVNGWFLYAALSTHTGLVAQEPYRKGLAYNERIAASDRQQLLGWTAEVRLAKDGFEVRLQDEARAPVAGQTIDATIGRPSTVRFDKVVKLKETAPGVYASAPLSFEPGAWTANVEVRSRPSTEPEYRLRRRLWLQ